MKNGELTIFADIVNDAIKDDLESKGQVLAKDHWINEPLKSEDDKTLLLVAVQEANHDCMEILLRSGADPNLFSHELQLTPLILATRQQDVKAMEILVKFGADVNMAAFKTGETALHEACNRSFTKGVTFLLKQPKIEVNSKDKKGSKTPLFCAIKSKDVESVALLIANGADLEMKVVGKSIRDHLASKLPYVDPDSIGKVKANIARQTSLSTLEKLENMIEDLQNNDDVEMFKSLLLEVGEHELDKYRSGGHTLLQKACWSGKTDLVKALLDTGMNINGLAEGSKLAPVLISACQGDTATLDLLLSQNPDITMTKVMTNDTILHCFLKQDQNMDVDYLKLLLNPKSEELDAQMQSIINKKDINDNTALHYAAQRWPQEAVRYLLEAGANIGMKNQFGEVAITQISAETFEAFLNEYCMKNNNLDVNHDNFELTFDYRFLAPSNEDLPKNLQQQIDPEDPSMTKLVDSSEKFPLPETEALWHMGQSKEHRHLLKHPVITSFLWLKWLRIRRYFNRNLRFYLLFVYLLTWYIFENFGGLSLNPEKNTTIPFFYGLYIVFTVIVTGFILLDWKNDLSDIMRVNASKDELDQDSGLSCGDVIKLILSNWIEAALLTGLTLILIFGAQSLFTALIITTGLLALREFFQVTVSLRRYLLSPENWIEVTTIILIGIILFHNDEDKALKRHLSAIAIVLSWAELITLVGKHPKLTRYNVYVTMFYKVLGTFCFFLLWYAFFIVAFGLAFYILLHKDDGSPIGEDDYIYFNKPWLALVKTSTMFVGELEFSDIPIDVDSQLGPLAYLFFLSFVFLIVVVLMNLLNGLAVSDTGIIQEKAEIVTYISRVDTISYTESVLLGDPFNFLSNWPAFQWLKNIPSLSCCSQLHKHKLIQDVFYKITGATGILLFYSFMKEARMSIKPNDRSQQCQQCIRVHEMDPTIIASAKKIISEQNKESKIDTLEAKLETMQELLKLMNQKLDQLK